MAIDHLKEVNHKRPYNDSNFDFINKSTTSNIIKESLEQTITELVNKNLITNKKSYGVRLLDATQQLSIVLSPILTQREDTADLRLISKVM